MSSIITTVVIHNLSPYLSSRHNFVTQHTRGLKKAETRRKSIQGPIKSAKGLFRVPGPENPPCVPHQDVYSKTQRFLARKLQCRNRKKFRLATGTLSKDRGPGNVNNLGNFRANS